MPGVPVIMVLVLASSLLTSTPPLKLDIPWPPVVVLVSVAAWLIAAWWINRGTVRGLARPATAAARKALLPGAEAGQPFNPVMGRHNRRQAFLMASMPIGLVVCVLIGVPQWWQGVFFKALGIQAPFIAALLTLTPWALCSLANAWFAEPIHRRLNQALVMRRLDQGRPVPVFRWRLAHTVRVARTASVATALPALLLLGLIHAVHAFAPEKAAPFWLIGGVIVTQALAPILAIAVLPTQPMPDGPTRQMLEDVLSQTRVRIAGLRLWDTDQTMINAAALGSFRWTRQVLLTDGLLNEAPDNTLKFVLAHELGHLKWRHHRLILLTSIAIAAGTYTLLLHALPPSFWKDPFAWPVVLGVIGIAWYAVTMAVMRRIEQQADAYATKTLNPTPGSGTGSDTAPGSGSVPGGTPESTQPVNISPATIGRAQQALKLLHRFSTGTDAAHGTLSSRLKALQELTDQPADALPIDRRMRWIRWSVYCLLVLSILSLAS